MKNTPDSSDPSNQAVADQVARSLQQQEQALPRTVTEQLAAARYQALKQGIKQRRRQQKVWLPLGAGAALTAVLLLAVIVLPGETPEAPMTVVAAESPEHDWELVIANPDYELLENELEFYAWLAEEQG